MANEKFQKRIDEPFDDDSSKYRRVADEYHTSAGVIVGRILISVLLTVLLAATLMWSLLYTIAHGPSEDYRIKLVTEKLKSYRESFVGNENIHDISTCTVLPRTFYGITP